MPHIQITELYSGRALELALESFSIFCIQLTKKLMSTVCIYLYVPEKTIFTLAVSRLNFMSPALWAHSSFRKAGFSPFLFFEHLDILFQLIERTPHSVFLKARKPH